ncbi:MAG: NlpC/P60 family protein [Fidelibacterota bacterium]
MTKHIQSRSGSKCGYVTVSVANIHSKPSFSSEVVTQALLGEQLEILDRNGSWVEISQWDGYQGWINHSALTERKTPIEEFRTVLDLFNSVYEEADSSSLILRDVVFGSRLGFLRQKDRWSQVVLPDGVVGWINTSWEDKQDEDIRGQIVKTARKFLGIQYLWGGKSPKGFDCSGFVQTVMGSVGIELPRDAYQQESDENLVESTLSAAEPGDLIFFKTGANRTDHVAISLGKKGIIHSSGFVKIESLDKESEDYNRRLGEHISTVKSIRNFC